MTTEKYSAVRAFAPATVANVGCGYDVFGFAVDEPGDEVTVRHSPDKGVVINAIEGDDGRLSRDPTKNCAGVVAVAMLDAVGASGGIELTLYKGMPLGSGLGSSAASAVACAVAMNTLLGHPFDNAGLMPFLLEGERVACGTGHADNVAPALYGGFTLVRSYTPLEVISIPVPRELYCSLVHPHSELLTADARKVIGNTIPLNDAIATWANTAAMVVGLMTSNYALIGRALDDVIIEPVRSPLIPHFAKIKSAACDAGAVGCSISGAGPSLFALSESEAVGFAVSEAMGAACDRVGMAHDLFVSCINQEGAKVVEIV